MQKRSPPPACELTAGAVEQALRRKIRLDKADFLPGFFRAVPGGYGEGDQFLGVVVPDQRNIAKQFRALALQELEELLQSPWHECRLTALYVLVDQYQRAATVQRKQTSAGGKSSPRKVEVGLRPTSSYVDFYLAHLDRVNNWDLVDSSAHKILGDWLVDKPGKRHILRSLGSSGQLWRERVAVVATYALIKADQFDEILELSTQFLGHSHDLIHKAVGWMLREMGKRDVDLLRGFLKEHSGLMPRTMLRYSIEKMSREERTKWLTLEVER